MAILEHEKYLTYSKALRFIFADEIVRRTSEGRPGEAL